MRLAIELTPEVEIILIRNEAQFAYCTREESDQPEEIIEYTGLAGVAHNSALKG